MTGKLVAVGGHSRHVGKTCMVNAIRRATPELDWHAVKISNHRHGSPSIKTANLLRLTDSEFARGITVLRRLLDEGRNVLVESNRIVSHLDPDLVIFVIDPLNADWKASSAACVARADALVFSGDGVCPAELPRVLPAFRLAAWAETPMGFHEWIRERLKVTEVAVHEDSLHRPDVCLAADSRANGAGARTSETGQCAGAGFLAYAAGSLELV